MIYCAHIAISLCLVIIQTTVLPNLSPAGHFYDLLIPLLIYLALFRPSHESLPFVFFLGLLMDNLSGTPFGLYLTTYFWIYSAVKMVGTFFRVGNRAMMALMVCGGVLIQNFLMVTSALLMDGAWLPPAEAASIITNQLLWALFTGPLLMMLFRYSMARLERVIDQLLAKNQT